MGCPIEATLRSLGNLRQQGRAEAEDDSGVRRLNEPGESQVVTRRVKPGPRPINCPLGVPSIRREVIGKDNHRVVRCRGQPREGPGWLWS